MLKLPKIGRKQLGIAIFLVTTFLAILVNSAVFSSPIVGTIASVIYFILVGYLLGKVFLDDNEEGLIRCIFGVFLLISLLILVGTPVIVFYDLDVLGLAIILCGPLILLTSYAFYLKLRRRNFRRSNSKTENTDDVPHFSPVYLVFTVLFAYSVFLLIESRSGWVYGPVWNVVSPLFFLAYFLATFVLIGILLYSRTKRMSKMLLTIMYSILSSSVFALVLYPSSIGDPLSHMAWARMLLNYGNLRMGYTLSPFTYYLLLKEKGLALLVATVAKMFTIDIYWVHTFMIPVLWGVFIPSTTYKIAKTIGFGEKVSWLAAFLTAFNPGFIEWGSRSVAISLGYIFLFVSLYFSLRYIKFKKTKILLLGAVSALVSGLAHPLTGIMSVSFLFFASTLKTYYTIRAEGRSRIGMAIVSFLICIIILPFAFFVQNFVYLNFAPAGISLSVNVVEFSFEKLLETDVWALIFGEYVEYTFKDLVFSAVALFLGIVGFGYTLSKRRKYSRGLILFMFSVFIICLIHYRVLQYIVVNPIFGPRRVWTIRDFIAIPFAALVINLVAEFLEKNASVNSVNFVLGFKRWTVGLSARRIIAGVLIGLSLSAFALSSIDKSYIWLEGLQPTQLEVEAVKYIDENTDGRYVVITMPVTTTVGRGFLGASLGLWNPEKYYFYSWSFGADPSAAATVMYQYLEAYEATVGYFIASDFRTPDYESVVAEASTEFVPFKTFNDENGEIQIFYIKLPPLHVGSDVNAFYWDAPPGYIIQNEFMRVTYNLGRNRLDVTDPWKNVYESLDLNETLIDGNPLGDFVSIELYNASDGTWVEWNPNGEMILTRQFKFKLNFESESLIGVVESGKSYVELSWEEPHVSTLSLHTGDFNRLYIPGLANRERSLSHGDYGLLYTLSRNSKITLRPVYMYTEESSSLNFSQIEYSCRLNTTEGYFWYDLYVQNKDETGQWAFIEVWLPDVVYESIFAVMHYSSDDGETWSESLAYADYPTGEPIETLNGSLVNWGFSQPGNATEIPVVWRTYTKAIGGYPAFPPYFTSSGGGQNRILFGVYLPAKNVALLRLGASRYNLPSQKITYVFSDSDNPHYGLRNMEEGLIIFYKDDLIDYAGGLESTQKPTSLAIIEDEGKIESLIVTIPSNSSIYLLSAYGINIRIDEDDNGIPDYLEK